MKNIAIIGITGSIGFSTVQVVKKHPQHFRISLASSHNNLKELIAIGDELKIDNIVSTGPKPPKSTKKLPPNLLFGKDELFSLLKDNKYDIVINAVSGSAGLIYSYHILKYNHTLALANKESLVLAGDILTKMTDKIIPIDSEHSALFQLLNGLQHQDVKNLILTASGGPFLNTPISSFDKIIPAEALNHPVWSMGAKVTIDSSTMFNKGLEVIEAHHLFGFDYSQIRAVIHPQSIVHSMVECNDGSILSQMSTPSMCLPILYALSYPDHIVSDQTQTDLFTLPPLTFLPIDRKRYPLYYLAIEVGKVGGLMPTVLNAANEAAIKLFLENKITYTQIYQLIDDYIDGFNYVSNPDIDTILQANDYVFQEVYNAF